MIEERVVLRRRYSAQMKASVLEQCAAPGASVAKVAMSHGVNANIVHRWRKLERCGALATAATSATPASVNQSAIQFVPLTLPVSLPTASPQHQPSPDIRIDLRRGATSMAISWPIAAADECTAWMCTWMRELLVEPRR